MSSFEDLFLQYFELTDNPDIIIDRMTGEKIYRREDNGAKRNIQTIQK